MASDVLLTVTGLDTLTPSSSVGGEDRRLPPEAAQEKPRRRRQASDEEPDESVSLETAEAAHKIDRLA